MSGIRAVDLGLVMPDKDDAPPARPRVLSYDFSRWNNPGEADELPANDEAWPDSSGVTPVSFKVYTPQEIKAAPLPVRRTPPPPPPEDGIKDVQEALAIAKELGPRGLLARFGVGVVAGAMILVSLIMFATLADDTPETRGILTASTETTPISAAPLTMAIAPAPTAYELIGDLDAPPSDPSYIELPDQAAPTKTAKRGGKPAAGAKRTIVRTSPF